MTTTDSLLTEISQDINNIESMVLKIAAITLIVFILFIIKFLKEF